MPLLVSYTCDVSFTYLFIIIVYQILLQNSLMNYAYQYFSFVDMGSGNSNEQNNPDNGVADTRHSVYILLCSVLLAVLSRVQI